MNKKDEISLTSHSFAHVNPEIEIDEKSSLITKRKTALKDSILIRTVSFGLNGFFLAAHLATNSKFLALLGPEGAGAGALVSTYQSVVVGGSIGILLSTGLVMGPHVGKQEYKQAGYIAKTAWVLTAGLGACASGVLIATRGIFPLIFDAKTAKMASDFFTGYSIGTIPLLMLITGPQIAFQAGDWFIPPATMFAFFASSGFSSYFLAFNAKLGAFGVGLGGSISSLAVMAALKTWFLRENYKQFSLFNRFIPGFKSNLGKLLGTGWKLSLQRLSEWSNLMLITTLIGINSERALKATHPGDVYIILLATTMQGIAQGAGMLITKNRGALDKALENGNVSEAIEWHHKNKLTFIQNNVFSMLASAAIGGSFYFAREPLTTFFLSADASDEVKELAQTLFWINLVGLIPDAVRIASAGTLRGWQDILYPTLVSLLMMVVIGVPAGYGLGKAFGNEPQFLFYMRDLTMLISAAIIVHRFSRKYSEDAKKLSASIKEESSVCTKCFLPPFAFFKKAKSQHSKAIEPNDIVEEDRMINQV